MNDEVCFYNAGKSYGFLSNFYLSPIVLDDDFWLTVEHYYQAQKFADPALRAAIRHAPTPGEAKTIAWSLAGCRSDWDQVRDQVMLTALRAKFEQHPDLRAQLLATGSATLREHTAHDHYWGDGGNGSGKNRLGYLLTRVRAEQGAYLNPSVNRIVLDWLFASNQIDLHRGDIFAAAPSPHLHAIDWNRVEGMLLGLAIGDALGNTSEAQNPPERMHRYGEIRNYLPNHNASNQRVGLPSDDSQMSFWTLDQLNRDHRLIPRSLAVRFTQEQIFGIGGSVQEFLRNFRDHGEPWYAAGPASAGNGALMRIAPVLIPHLHYPSLELWVDTALAAMITHNDSSSTAACLAFVAILWDLLDQQTVPNPQWWIDRYVGIAQQLERSDKTPYRPRGGAYQHYVGPLWQYTAERLTHAYARNLTTLAACESWHSAAYLMETLPSALYILMRHAGDPEAAIVRAVNDTRDNDTIAAIVGAAVGALHGTQALPLRWRQNLLGRLGASDDGRLFQLLAATRQIWL